MPSAMAIGASDVPFSSMESPSTAFLSSSPSARTPKAGKPLLEELANFLPLLPAKLVSFDPDPNPLAKGLAFPPRPPNPVEGDSTPLLPLEVNESFAGCLPTTAEDFPLLLSVEVYVFWLDVPNPPKGD